MNSNQSQSLVLIRGLPGSGKSTLARIYSTNGFIWYETDMWFETPYGYDFQSALLTHNHQACKDAVAASLAAGHSVVVSNTFTRKWEMQPYIEMAKMIGATVQILICQGEFENIHNVPKEVINRMKERFEY